MSFGLFGGFGGLNGSMSSRWSLSGDGPNLFESDNITFKHSSTTSYDYSCFGGYSGGFSWGRAAGDLLGAATIFGLALLGRNRNQNTNIWGNNSNLFGGSLLNNTGFYGNWNSTYVPPANTANVSSTNATPAPTSNAPAATESEGNNSAPASASPAPSNTSSPSSAENSSPSGGSSNGQSQTLLQAFDSSNVTGYIYRGSGTNRRGQVNQLTNGKGGKILGGKLGENNKNKDKTELINRYITNAVKEKAAKASAPPFITVIDTNLDKTGNEYVLIFQEKKGDGEYVYTLCQALSDLSVDTRTPDSTDGGKDFEFNGVRDGTEFVVTVDKNGVICCENTSGTVISHRVKQGK